MYIEYMEAIQVKEFMDKKTQKDESKEFYNNSDNGRSEYVEKEMLDEEYENLDLSKFNN